jgi:patatin-like phospholipase/acyl hydrolase
MKKILSLDGGGIRGMIPATILNEIEKRTGQGIATSFDLIAGTSTGGVMALFLCVPDENGEPKYSAHQAMTMYRDRGSEFFNKSFWRDLTTLAGLTDEKYSTESIEKIFYDYVGETTLGMAVTDVLISSYHLEGRRPYFFKSWRDDNKPVPMRFAARATSAAPTFFTPTQAEISGEVYSLVDGGVFANNPAMCAYVEARRLWPDEEDLLIVSIGTGENAQPIPFADASDWGLAQWAVPILEVVFDGVNDAVNYQLNLLLPDSYYRFQSRLSIASEYLDDISPKNMAALQQEGEKILAENTATFDTICDLLTQNN